MKETSNILWDTGLGMVDARQRSVPLISSYKHRSSACTYPSRIAGCGNGIYAETRLDNTKGMSTRSVPMNMYIPKPCTSSKASAGAVGRKSTTYELRKRRPRTRDVAHKLPYARSADLSKSGVFLQGF
jgi:hypothetical protein